MMQVERALGPVGEDVLVEIERTIGAALPLDYRRFLAEFGGGRVYPDSFNFADGSDGSFVDELYKATLDKRVYGSIPNMRGVFSDAIPPELLPIGRDPGGNQICIGLRGPRAGQILFWDHESGEIESVEDALGRQDLRLIAPSFTTFTEALFELE